MEFTFDPRWPQPLKILNEQIICCRLCPRLVAWREEVAATKRRAYRDWEYWGRPVPSFGDPQARLLIVGLAPAAHGANRTGRMFTGDRSGDFLYRALHETGFANQPFSSSRQDGLRLIDAFITAPVRCAPPDNKPEPREVLACEPFLDRELHLLTNVRVVVALGNIGFTAYLRYLQRKKLIGFRSPFRFGHSALHRTHESGPLLLGCFHPSQQNTSTGRLTAEMLRDVFARARQLIQTPEG
jgi:uracil-DNA glycosylase